MNAEVAIRAGQQWRLLSNLSCVKVNHLKVMFMYKYSTFLDLKYMNKYRVNQRLKLYANHANQCTLYHVMTLWRYVMMSCCHFSLILRIILIFPLGQNHSIDHIAVLADSKNPIPVSVVTKTEEMPRQVPLLNLFLPLYFSQYRHF